MSIWTQKSALIQLRTSLLKFDDLAEKYEKSSVSNFSSKVVRVRAEMTAACPALGKCGRARGTRAELIGDGGMRI